MNRRRAFASLLAAVLAAAGAYFALHRGPGGGQAALRHTDLPIFSGEAGSAEPREGGSPPPVGPVPAPGPDTLGGTVLDGEGRPVAGAEVAASADAHRTPVRGQSGMDGRFLLEGLPTEADLLVGVRAPGYPPVMTGSVRAGRNDLVLVLSPPVQVRGAVRSRTGEPRPGALVRVVLRFPGVALPVPIRDVHADENGAFVLEGLPPVEGTAEATWQGTSSGPVPFDGRKEGGRVSVFLIVEQGPALSGRVLDREGRPLAGIGVSVRKPDGYYISGSTREDGTFSIACLSTEPHGLSATDPRRQYTSATYAGDVTPPRSGLDLVMEPNPDAPGWFEFRCVDPAGKPVEHLFGEGWSVPPGEARLGEWEPESDGVFRSAQEGTGIHVYRFRSPLGTVLTGEFEVVAGKVTDLGLLRLSPGARVRLRVVDDAGRPLDGALVLVGETRIPERRSETDPAVFDVPGLPPGSGVVRIAHPTRERREIPWAAGPGETADLGDVVLAAGTGTVRGIVKSETHGPVPGITLTLTMKGISTRGDTHLTTVSGAGGRFEFTGVAAGEWESAFLLPATPDELDRDGKRSLLSFRRGPEVVLEPGGTAEIEIPW